jgi:hypothetical protein
MLENEAFERPWLFFNHINNLEAPCQNVGMPWSSPGKGYIDFWIRPWTDGWGLKYIMQEINAIWLHRFPDNKYAPVTDAFISVSFILNSKQNLKQWNTLQSTPRID